MVNFKALSSSEEGADIIDKSNELEVEIVENKKSYTAVIVAVLAIGVLGFTAGSMYFINKVSK